VECLLLRCGALRIVTRRDQVSFYLCCALISRGISAWRLFI
jgi:hypothetical protein